MATNVYRSVKLTEDCYKRLEDLRAQLEAKGTTKLPVKLRPTRTGLGLSTLVEMGVTAIECVLK